MQQNISTYDFAGKKAIVRVDFNVPLNEKFEITDDTRMRAAIPTLKKVLEKGGSLIIMSHLGRPKGVTEKFSLKHILPHLEELLGRPVKFADDCMKADAQAAALKLRTPQTRRRRQRRPLSRKARRSSSRSSLHTQTATSTTRLERLTAPTHRRPSSPTTSLTTRCSAM